VAKIFTIFVTNNCESSPIAIYYVFLEEIRHYA